ncbi:class I SAM-dependent methyltransferase [Alphaproteobacteria bacterium]|nr:class I SAM-dependent methyltransferase [Alphaproteobacteria bacterium]
MTSTDIISAYNKIASSYEEYSNRRAAYLNAVENLILDRLPDNAEWLDVGCGDGRRLAKLVAVTKPLRVECVEPSIEMARLCQDKTSLKPHIGVATDIPNMKLGKFDVITGMWNVLGHVPDDKSRVASLQAFASVLKKDGVILMDVNNRHNAHAYGTATVLWRRFLDHFFYDDRRGDASFFWEINGSKIPATGHLFTMSEIITLAASANLRLSTALTVDYQTGALSESKFQGQLFLMLQHS